MFVFPCILCLDKIFKMCFLVFSLLTQLCVDSGGYSKDLVSLCFQFLRLCTMAVNSFGQTILKHCVVLSNFFICFIQSWTQVMISLRKLTQHFRASCTLSDNIYCSCQKVKFLTSPSSVLPLSPWIQMGQIWSLCQPWNLRDLYIANSA